MRNSTVITLLSFLLLSLNAWSQSNCPNEYSQISASCIASLNKPFTDKPITLSNELSGNIYFYKTPAGDLGKLRVIATTIDSKRECTLYLDAVTFSGDKVFIPNSSISIRADKSNWLKDRIFLDREGLSALEMEKNAKGLCSIFLTKGAEIVFFRKHVEGKAKEENYLLFLAPLVLVFIAIFLIVRVFMEDQDKFKTQEALEEAENSGKVKNEIFFIKITKPFYKRYFVPMVSGAKNKQAIRTKWRQKLANGGLIKEMTPEEFVALKFFMILGGPFAFLTIRWIMSETWPLSITPVMAIVGYFYPDLWLSGLIKKRGEETLRAMPFIVDMLALSVEAGLDFMAAIQRVIEKAPKSPLVEEFETLIRETKIGSSRAEGLRQLAWRVNIIEINSFCATLIAADSVGASIGPLLKQLSAELRVKRSSRAEQLGATAATKILIPMIFFILPAVLVAIFAPMALKMMAGKL
ncbi:type II secretion system F family protein [Peredibacter sp. HCB2-198]|uniref:type II secretion system F family protein n=1 Tax=Peredibacter sp. HCB2-198 TaxID=3383025 RepID=UPI0038B41AB3